MGFMERKRCPFCCTLEAIRDVLLEPLEEAIPALSRSVPRIVDFLVPPPHDIEYCWLDILCLRQAWRNTVGTQFMTESEVMKRHTLPANILLLKQKRLMEWEIDVPTIGATYRRTSAILVYMNGIGRPFSDKKSDWESPYHWVNRTWTLTGMCIW